MANNEDDIKIVFGAEANEASGEQAGKKLEKSVKKGIGNDGHVKVPIDITVPIDKNKDKLTKAQQTVITKLNKMTSKGFSASAKDIDDLSSKFKAFTEAFDKAGKGRQNKIFKEIRRQVEDVQKAYRALKTEQSTGSTKVSKTSSKKTKKTAEDRYLEKQAKYSERAQGATKRTQYKGVETTGPQGYKTKSGVDASKTSDHMMRLSEYSAHGSNWANELARILKEETAKAAKTLVTYIDSSYKPKEGRATTEKEFLSDTIKKARAELKSYISQLEAGSEEVTLDMLKETSAVIKVLTKALGKTTEQAEKSIYSAIESRYSDKATKRLGGTGLEEGQEKGVGPGHENTQKLVKGLYESMKQWDSEVIADNIAKEMVLGTEKTIKNIESKRKRTSTESKATTKISEIKSTDAYKTELAKLNSRTDDMFTAVKEGTKSTEKQTNLDKIENVREAIADNKEQTIETVNRDINKDTAGAVKEDVNTGFNTDSKADELIGTIKKTDEVKLPDDITGILKSILAQVTAITTMTKAKESKRYKVSKKDNTKSSKEDRSFEMKAAYAELGEAFEPVKKALIPVLNSVKVSTETPKAVSRAEFNKLVPKLIENEEPKDKVQKSKIYASPFRQGPFKALEDAFMSLTGATRSYEKVLNANAEEQDKMAAKRIDIWGLNNGRNPNDTGDIAGMRRILQLYRTNKSSIEQNPELRQKIKLTSGVDVDTTELTKTMNKALSGRQMKNAQNGGGFLKNAFGFMTGGLGYALLPSLEKSRAQADGLNQIFGNINKALQSVLINIQTKETELAGMEKSGQAKFDKNGYLTSDSTSAAFKTLADLEEEKYVLETIKADLLANDEIIKRTGGRFSALVKNLSYTSPVLKENNGILRNINSGLDKNGKALKFQTRMAEILNYTYQLMSRSIGQMIKNWLTMLNPINLIKKAFSDFGSYDVKWQRTMNVIKINFQRIIKPAMEWIAQKLVNIIGFFDIVSQRIQAAFGKIPISLFDQAGAESEQIRRNLEEAANVQLGFDEFHDIGTDQSGANDLTGEIYKPQLSQDWIDMATKLGDTLGAFFKGDLGFGEVCKVILELLGKLLSDIGKAIWGWFKETALGKWITEHWKGLLATLLALFLGWQLLKIFGPTLLGVIGNAFKNLGSLIWGGLKGVGSKFLDVLCGTQFGSDMVRGFKAMFNSGGMIGTFKAGGASLGAIFAQALVAVAGVAIATGSIMKGFDMVADDTSYNLGLMENGGDSKDKKSGAGGKAVGTIGGAAGGALVGLAIGGPIGAAIGAGIGAIAGLLTTSLAPAFEEAEVAARKANNEMQKIEYYEGAVKGAQTQVDKFDELLDMSNQTLQVQSDKVYALGEKYGVSKTYLDSLVQAMKDGNYNSEMAVGLNDELSTALDQLDWHYQNNAGLTDKLTEAKKKLQKAELDLAIANDIEAGNFEMAAARIEYAMAAGLYETDEAAKKMSQIMKETSFTESKELLNNMSPELKQKWEEYVTDIDQGRKDMAEIFEKMSESERKELLNSNDNALKQKWFTYATTTEKGKKELSKMYAEMNEEEREAFTKDYSSEAGGAMGKAIDAMQKEINSATFDWSHPFKSLGSMFSGDWSWKAKYASFDVGTNYVPNDGFAYIHKGEAIIPADENVFAKQGAAWQGQTMMNDRMMSMITSLEQTLKQGINVSGEFRQRGSDLVAVTEKAKNRNGHQPLNNPVFAR